MALIRDGMTEILLTHSRERFRRPFPPFCFPRCAAHERSRTDTAYRFHRTTVPGKVLRTPALCG